MIGRNLARLRGSMTQQQLADEMRNLGFKWSQSTVWSIEQGTRPIRLTEALALNRVFGVGSETRLAWPEPMVEVQDRMRAVSEAARQVRESIEELQEKSFELAVVTARHEPGDLGRLYEAVEDWMSYGIPEVVDELRLEQQAERAANEVRYADLGEIPQQHPLIERHGKTWTYGERSEAS